MKDIKLYWCRGKGRDNPHLQNFGDYLSPLLVELLSGRKVRHAPVHRADLIAIGSVLGRERKARRFGLPRRLHIWGTGTGCENETFSGRHYYHAVRGQLTLAKIKNGPEELVLGDPGLLAPMVLSEGERRPEKRYRIGLIPHYADQHEPTVGELRKSLPGVEVIDVYGAVRSVVAEIARCDFVLSSSLHGLIVADAFGIPNQWLFLSRGRISEYKFADYYTAFGLQNMLPVYPETILRNGYDFEQVRSSYRRPGLDVIQKALLGAFPSL